MMTCIVSIWMMCQVVTVHPSLVVTLPSPASGVKKGGEGSHVAHLDQCGKSQ